MKKQVNKFLALPPVSFSADIVRIYFAKQVNRSAAQLAYFLILTFFPFLICISAFLGRFNLATSSVMEVVRNLLPEGVFSIFSDYLGYLDNNLSAGMFLAGLFMMVLFASAAIRGISSAMRELYGQPRARGLLHLFYTIPFALFLLVTIYLSVVVVLSGNWFFHMVGDLFGLADLAHRFGVWQWIKYLLLLAVVFLFILMLYRFTSPVRTLRPPIIPGALLSAVVLAAASSLFAAIVSRSARYSLVYGSLASVIILLVWLYLCGNILILGNVFNYVIYSRRKK